MKRHMFIVVVETPDRVSPEQARKMLDAIMSNGFEAATETNEGEATPLERRVVASNFGDPVSLHDAISISSRDPAADGDVGPIGIFGVPKGKNAVDTEALVKSLWETWRKKINNKEIDQPDSDGDFGDWLIGEHGFRRIEGLNQIHSITLTWD